MQKERPDRFTDSRKVERRLQVNNIEGKDGWLESISFWEYKGEKHNAEQGQEK